MRTGEGPGGAGLAARTGDGVPVRFMPSPTFAVNHPEPQPSHPPQERPGPSEPQAEPPGAGPGLKSGDLAELGRVCAATRGEDRPAFEELHARLSPGIRGFFAKRTRGRTSGDAADELTQRVMIGLFEALKRGRFDPERASISTFAYAIAAKTWLRHLRERRSRGGVVSDNEWAMADEAVSALGGRGDALEDAAGAELLEATRRALRERGGPGNLTDEEYAIVTAAAAGASDRALAERLGLAASTVNVKKQSGWEKLRRALARVGHRAEIAERERDEDE